MNLTILMTRLIDTERQLDKKATGHNITQTTPAFGRRGLALR